MILDGRMVAASVHEYIRKKITDTNATPHLAVILVGENPASESYIRMKERACKAVGIRFSLFRFPALTDETSVLAKIREINENPDIHGIIVQSPLPSHFIYRDIVEAISPMKDVDGFTRTNIGNLFLGDSDGLVSCTPKGIKKLLEAYKISMEGKHVVIIGRSNIVGKPMNLIALNAGATVTTCNSRTRNLKEITKTADILIVATGRIGLITQEMVGPKTVIVDVGCTFMNGRAIGDVDFESLKESVSAISPVPGGVGPMTVAMILENTWIAYESQQTEKSHLNYYSTIVNFRHQSEL
ncbi:bifunctional 5,10-methylenetetrahydrofolate dehydrogenase/5,10-methenyltetrahydrofolate cyclohydrolase [Candidatus Gracilibacteria bacterium]|nr:bifunctional 5,10-methylenetetrahydrofolate dehydrogenase/5,10-methenyltetrahydrofolate cyclohydrolase [Candidatus Gracilibacteria bacterium]